MPLWYDRIAAAETPDALLAAARDYLAMLTPEDLADVPEPFRAMRLKGLDDFAYWQKRLAEEYCDGGALREGEAAIVSQLLAFFTTACEHRARLARAAPEGVRSLFSDKSIPKLFKEQAPPT
jgi:hypothetical protein